MTPADIDSPHRLPDQLPADVTDSPPYRRVRRDLEGLTCGQLQHLKVHVIGVVQRALEGVTYHTIDDATAAAALEARR